MTLVAAVFAALSLLLAAGPGSWLDAKTTANWNAAGATLPARPGPRDDELAPGGRCAASQRPPTSLEDRALIKRGWSLFAPYQRYGPTAIVMGMSGADGMCRPTGYQVFVFVNGTFAGTLSPKLMDSRTDGSINGMGVTIYSATEISADFARYRPQDALCCPHATTNVLYRVSTTTPPRVTPNAPSTQPNGT